MKLYQYKIFCDTDSRFEYVWKSETALAPTTCPVDTNHVCSVDSVAIHEVLDTAIVQVDVQKTPDPAPFATPSFRTKWDASPDVVTTAENQTVVMDYTMTEERYAHGGSIIFEGTKIGDKLEAMIVDPNGVIPEPFRAIVCEDYPIVAQYIYRHYLPAGEGVRELNTYPLNAKITPGLVLRVTIHTCSTPGTRKFATNYLLTKKL
jgi:hypothetical protein